MPAEVTKRPMHIERFIFVVVLLSMTGMQTTSGADAREDQPASASTVLRVATLNLAHGRGLSVSQFTPTVEEFRTNIEAIAVAIRTKNPDVIALQEADGRSAWSGLFHHVDYIADRAGYEFVHHGIHFETGIGDFSVRYGTALLSNRPLRSKASHRSIVHQFHTKGFVTAELDFSGHLVVVVSLHLDSSSADARRQEARNIIDILSALKQPLIVMGDFNSRWTSETDAVRMIATRLKLQAFQPDSNNGTHSQLAESVDRPTLLTFPSNAPVRRIDWILISHALEFVDYAVWPEKISDHLGVAATIRWRLP